MIKIIKLEYLQFIYIYILAFSLISPPLTNVLEIILFIGIIICTPIYEKLKIYFLTQEFKLHFLFGLIILISGALSPLVNSETYSSSILSWRKFLLLPIGYILFYDSQKQKEKALRIIFYFILILTVVNLVYKTNLLYFFNMNAIKYQIGSSSSEGMYVSVALAIIMSHILSKKKLFSMHKGIGILLTIYLITYISIVTTGRSGYLAMMVILLFMGYKYINASNKKNKIKTWIILGASSVLSILLLMSSDTASRRIGQAVIEFQQAEKNATENIVTSIGQRVIFWENTLKMVPQYFFFGTGTGGFQEAYSKQVINKSGLEGVITQDPHNQYLKILIEQGIIGLFIFIKILTNAICQKNINDDNYIIGTSVICIWILTSLFNAHFTTFMEGTFIWAWLGLMNKYRKNP